MADEVFFHSPTPWEVDDEIEYISDANGDVVCRCFNEDRGEEPDDEDFANAEHIVRCVNAFDDLLESLGNVLVNAGEVLALRFAGLAVPDKVWKALVDASASGMQVLRDVQGATESPQPKPN